MEISYKNALYTASYLAKSCGLKSAKELNLTLERLKIQKKDKFSNTWKFTEEYKNKGYDVLEMKRVSSNKEILNRKFTWNGFIKIRDILEKEGILKKY